MLIDIRRTCTQYCAPFQYSNTPATRRDRRRQRQQIEASALARLTGSRFTLQDGSQLELQHSTPTQASRFPPLLLVHGSYHGAWCWQEHFMPYLAGKGFESYAVSLRGQGQSDRPADLKANSLGEHATDIIDLLTSMPRPPILVGHSFGGLLVQRFFLGDGNTKGNEPPVAGLALMCSATPHGNKAVVSRLAKKDLWATIRLTWSFISRNFLRNTDICRWMFFSEDLPAEDLDRYSGLLKQHSSPIPVVNVWRMRKEIPLPDAPPGLPPVLVMGGDRDLILDEQALKDTAKHFGTEAVIMQDMAHDCMLDTRWQQAADTLIKWVTGLQRAS